jgi:hypothetical protein
MRTPKFILAYLLFIAFDLVFLTSCTDNSKEPTVQIEYQGEDTEFFITKQNTVGSKKYSEYSYKIEYGEDVIYGYGSKEFIDSIVPIEKKKIVEIHNTEKSLNEKHN